MLSFPLFMVATVHLFVAGTERHNQVVIFSTVIVSTLVFFLVVVRLLARYAPRTPSTSRVPAAARAATRQAGETRSEPEPESVAAAPRSS